MRKASVRSAITALAVLLGVALATPSAAAGAPSQDSVVGFLSELGADVRIDVRSGPAGEAPTGQFTIGSFTPSNSEDFRTTSISCLAVRGAAAVAGGFGVLERSGLGPEGPVHETRNTGFIAVVQDNGAPPPPPDGPFPTAVDDFNYSYVTAPDCAAPGISPVRFPWIGDFTVVDAPSVPTPKEQCRDDGWKRYDTAFKSQGQCVAFVARGPKP
jgi:hypothetical protein